MKELRTYQDNAVSLLIDYSKIHLKTEGKETIIFQAPTGSGKTFMATKYIERLVDEVDDDFCFLWFCIGKSGLQVQSYKSVKRDISDAFRCSLIDNEFSSNKNQYIRGNEIVFANWEKLREQKDGEWTNTLMKDGENINFPTIIENTKKMGRKIILIIDESHSSADTKRAMELRDSIIDPDLTIEMSATPKISEFNSIVKVKPNDVIEAQMIKKEIVINQGLSQEEISNDEISSQELIMNKALEKQKELRKKYRQLERNINPLVLVQIPNSDKGETKMHFLKDYLNRNGINEENGKLAIWMSEEKVNNESDILLVNDGIIDVLIFKTALDTGWDCPRAQILVKFRETKSIEFEIQTVGRILRMPEAMHYTDEDLNKGYVFTNLKDIRIKEEIYNAQILKSLSSKRRDNYQNICLKSYYKNRKDYGYVRAEFHKIFEKCFCQYFEIKPEQIYTIQEMEEKLKKKNIDFNPKNAKSSIITDGIIKGDKFDDQEIEFKKNGLDVYLSTEEIEEYFIDLINANLMVFAPKRSIPLIAGSIYKTLNNYLGMFDFNNYVSKQQNFVVKNSFAFNQILKTSIEQYKPVHEAIVESKAEELIDENWEVPEVANYNPNVVMEYKSFLSLHKPLYVLKKDNKPRNELEVSFIDYLDEHSESVEWFYQNASDNKVTNFGIKKIDGFVFRPDFIIKFKDGRVGIFDTKPVDDRLDDIKEKAKALQEYLREETFKGKKLIGGIVINVNNQFRYNSNYEFYPYKEKPEEWEYFDNLLK